MQLAEEIGVKNLEAYGDSKLIVNQVHGDYEVRHEDLVPYHNATIDRQRSLKTSLLTMYRVSKMRMQMHWCLSLLHGPFQLELERVLVYFVT